MYVGFYCVAFNFFGTNLSHWLSHMGHKFLAQSFKLTDFSTLLSERLATVNNMMYCLVPISWMINCYVLFYMVVSKKFKSCFDQTNTNNSDI